jgi:leader peptidase (prepilin peptidase)/N-methyltransferase
MRYPVLELATGVLFALTVWLEPTWPERWVAWLFWGLLVAVAGTDMTCMRVPDLLSLPGAVTIFIGVVCTGLQSWSGAVAGAAACAGLLWLIHLVSKGRMGLGDVKLYLSIGAFLGPVYGIESFVFASFSGVLAGLILRALGALRRREYIPFVPHIVAGVVLATVFGPRWTAWYLSCMLR